MQRVHGDSKFFRSSLLGRRWWFYYRNTFGDAANYELELENSIGQRSKLDVVASLMLPDILGDEASFERQFGFELLANDTPIMRLDSFSWASKPEFMEFTKNSFASMRAAGTTKLIIDIRANEGGNDDMWIEGILPYLASRPYQWASRYIKRVLVTDPTKNEVEGQVLSAPLDRWINPSLPQSERFQGEVEVLIGPRTYSSAVLFANVIQDFQFGRIMGIGGSVRADQTGGTQQVPLPNSGLVMWWPRLIFFRPSGMLRPVYLEAEIAAPITGSPSMLQQLR